MKKIILSIGFLLLLVFSGCGSKDGVRTSAPKSYLYFTGNVNDVLVSVDKGAKFTIINGKNNQYAVKPGKHVIEIYKDNSMIVQREVYVGDGISKEIEVK